MAGIEVQHLLEDIDRDSPCGEDLEYDPEYAALERAMQPPAESMTGAADGEDQEGPDWAEIARRASGLFDRTKDLRIGVALARALLLTQGLTGFRDGLLVLHHLIGARWDEVHPRLDPDDGYDPTLRVNTLASLNDPDTTLRELRGVPLVVSRTFGPVSWRDVALATGELRPVGTETAAELSQIKAGFQDCDAAALLQSAAAAREAGELVQSIEQSVAEQVGVGQAADFSAVSGLLRSIARFLDERIKERGLAAETSAPAAVAPAAEAASEPSLPRPIAGEVSGRDDVVRTIDRLCDYFARYEPSSPVPILLRRAQDLVGKDFMEILRDLAPDGVPQAERFQVQAQPEE